MREQERIKRICEKLEQVWIKYPDMRLGQLIENFVCIPQKLWQQEDNITEEILNEVLKTL